MYIYKTKYANFKSLSSIKQKEKVSMNTHIDGIRE